MTELERIKEEADKAFAEKQTETTSTENETNVSEKRMPSSLMTFQSPQLTDMIRSGYNNKIDNNQKRISSGFR